MVNHLQFRLESLVQVGVHAELDVASAIILDGALPFLWVGDGAGHALESNLATSKFALFSLLHSGVLESKIYDLVHHLDIILVSLVILFLGFAEILSVDVLQYTLQGACIEFLTMVLGDGSSVFVRDFHPERPPTPAI